MHHLEDGSSNPSSNMVLKLRIILKKDWPTLPQKFYLGNASSRGSISQPFLKYGTKETHHLEEGLTEPSLNLVLMSHILLDGILKYIEQIERSVVFLSNMDVRSSVI